MQTGSDSIRKGLADRQALKVKSASCDTGRPRVGPPVINKDQTR